MLIRVLIRVLIRGECPAWEPHLDHPLAEHWDFHRGAAAVQARALHRGAGPALGVVEDWGAAVVRALHLEQIRVGVGACFRGMAAVEHGDRVQVEAIQDLFQVGVVACRVSHRAWLQDEQRAGLDLLRHTQAPAQ